MSRRIQQDHGKTLIDFIYSSPDVLNNKIVTEFHRNRQTSLSSEISISTLCVVIKTGKLLKLLEQKSVGHHNNTVGDLIDRIRLLRNIFLRTGEAHLDESDYDDYINDLKDIGRHFERINGETGGTYTTEIDEIHDTLFETSNVERIVVRYKAYVKIVQKIEMPAPVEERPDPPYCQCTCRHTLTDDCQCCHCRQKRQWCIIL